MLAARQFASRVRDSFVMSVPSTGIVPLSGWSMLAMRFSSVDLPVPLAPISETNSPSSMSSDTSSSGVIVSPPL